MKIAIAASDLCRNQTKTLLGIETLRGEYKALLTILRRNQTKTLLGIETRETNQGKSLNPPAAIKLKPY